jgi:hypothetical protein
VHNRETSTVQTSSQCTFHPCLQCADGVYGGNGKRQRTSKRNAIGHTHARASSGAKGVKLNGILESAQYLPDTGKSTGPNVSFPPLPLPLPLTLTRTDAGHRTPGEAPDRTCLFPLPRCLARAAQTQSSWQWPSVQCDVTGVMAEFMVSTALAPAPPCSVGWNVWQHGQEAATTREACCWIRPMAGLQPQHHHYSQQHGATVLKP